MQGHGFEKIDLITALTYEIEYREWYGLIVTWESGKAVHDLVTSMSISKHASNEIAKKCWEHNGEKFMEKVFKEPGKAKEGFSAAKLAAKVGWGISDSAFGLTKKTSLYYKRKAYAVLEEVLIDILNDSANDLRINYLDYKAFDTVIDKYYPLAKRFDYAFRMYVYVEKNGCLNYANYEQVFLITEPIDNPVEKVVKRF